MNQPEGRCRKYFKLYRNTCVTRESVMLCSMVFSYKVRQDVQTRTNSKGPACTCQNTQYLVYCRFSSYDLLRFGGRPLRPPGLLFSGGNLVAESHDLDGGSRIGPLDHLRRAQAHRLDLRLELKYSLSSEANLAHKGDKLRAGRVDSARKREGERAREIWGLLARLRWSILVCGMLKLVFEGSHETLSWRVKIGFRPRDCCCLRRAWPEQCRHPYIDL